MADDMVANGVDQSGDGFFDADQSGRDARAAELKKKIEALEREKDDLVNEYAGRKELTQKLTLEIEDLRNGKAELLKKVEEMEKEVEEFQESRRVAESIAKRAFDLETEVTRLQHDSIAEMSAAEEARAEADELRRALADKESRVGNLEREVEGLKKTKAESEVKVRDLEKKLGVLEKKEVEERNKRIRIEEELREKISEKEREVQDLKAKTAELEKVVVGNGSEMENWVEEKKNLEEALRESEDKAKRMELNILQLQQEASEAEDVIGTLREKAFGAVNGRVNGLEVEEKGLKGLKLQWPLVAAGSTGAIAAAAVVVYVFYGKRR
ncbi:peroxisomal and mitochondrial division factor 2-like [Prosopis cineraria]|uniref:peroxisomal and mitochondrial division factor 2-like n=1 Tax=Prosopis cineraria TaxID=364024 RepID=UPI00240EE236|nr:peroxisomal and mitochondrial division factor 2-like [Prosopis cineraria]XP_054796462.1 peroxisomal and mitochondrial division factor 2-like [Prosopis cineraria]